MRENLDLSNIKVISEFVDILSKGGSKEYVLREVADRIVKANEINSMIISLEDKEKNELYTYVMSSIPQAKVAFKVLNLDRIVRNIKISLDHPTNKIVKNFKQNTSFMTQDINDMTDGLVNERAAKMAQRLALSGTLFMTPIEYKGQKIGAVTFARRRRIDYTQDQVELMKTYGKLVGYIIGAFPDELE